MAIFLLYQSKNSLSVRDLQQALHVTHPTARRIRKYICAALPCENDWEEPAPFRTHGLPTSILERVCLFDLPSSSTKNHVRWHPMPMNTDLSHLSEEKQKELQRIADIIQQEAHPEMIILFGSYARGTQVESDVVKEGHITYEYRSDYDILAIVQEEAIEQDVNLWHQINQAIANDPLIQTPVSSPIVETIASFNQQLGDGRYFYVDIQKEGIVLYDSGRSHFTKPRTLTPDERRALAEEDKHMWLQKAQEFFEGSDDALERDHNNKAAFELHQSTEALLVCFLLVRTGYRAKTHDLEQLLQSTTLLDQRFRDVFPRETEAQELLFGLLKKAYVDARYSKNYSITKVQLRALRKHVGVLRELVEQACQEVIEGFGE